MRIISFAIACFLHNIVQSSLRCSLLCTARCSFHLTVRIIPTHRKYRHKWPVLVRGTAIYAVAKDILSRPIIGHTPRKLPALAAISRIIAVLARAAYPGTPAASLIIILDVSQNVKYFFSVFYKNIISFLLQANTRGWRFSAFLSFILSTAEMRYSYQLLWKYREFCRCRYTARSGSRNTWTAARHTAQTRCRTLSSG